MKVQQTERKPSTNSILRNCLPCLYASLSKGNIPKNEPSSDVPFSFGVDFNETESQNMLPRDELGCFSKGREVSFLDKIPLIRSHGV